MPREPRNTFRGYRLISTYLKLQEQEEIDLVYDEAFNRRLKALHIFCVILFATFIIDGFLPLREYAAKVQGVKVLSRYQKEISAAAGQGKTAMVVIPTKVEINTSEGTFTTSDIKGYEEPGAKIMVQKTFLFRSKDRICFLENETYVYPFINFHGNFIFWPLISLLMSLTFLLTQRFYGSNTLSVLALLNIVPFFSTLYMA